MQTESSSQVDLERIKASQRQAWSRGDYSITGSSLVIVAENLCEAADLHGGQKVLDVATGSGNTAIAAARRLCETTGLDYVPALLERGRERAAAERLPVTFVEGDAEHLPFADASFDVVMSTLGVMFAPDQEQAARELLRVCRPDGKIALASWTPDSLFSRIGRITAAYAPPPSGVKPPVLWGSEAYVRNLFGDEVTELTATKRTYFHRDISALHLLNTMLTSLGPLMTTLRTVIYEDRQGMLDSIIAAFEQVNQATDGTLVAPDEYLEVIAIRR
ncbi:class I SAM-dependent methyltransferase [Tengunoibacter tsumagoiensis]|uniref:Methyltransferase type 11 domain-containing protein n=1 Tax=Tengunoibacter tsumagoiensis TaxID=2014871 RepID=A0A402A9N9_9CHLR|nr:class I SAM-dependent methyltransferase [Tengunoibacter tsumagoiensis]GCE15808.1 hypothetical protein KTT_56670 [Tengunoibacter tsumagoiensis]